MAERVVVIASIDRRTGEEERAAFEVTPLPAPGTETAVLRELVRGIHPEAVERVGEGEVVIFDDAGRELRAWFETARGRGPDAPPGQASLFDA